MLRSLNRYDFQPHHFRLTHDVTLDNISTVDDADTAALVYECNKQNDVYQQQQQQQRPSTSLALLNKLQSRIQSRNQLNAAKSKLTTASDDIQSEKADSESAQTETPPDKKQKDDSRLAAVCRSPRIEEVAEAGLNALSNYRRRQITDSTVMCRNVELTPPTRVTSRLDEIRQRFRSETIHAQSSHIDHNPSGTAELGHSSQSQLQHLNSYSTVKPPERRVRSAAATRNMTLSLAEELQAALSSESSPSQPHRHHHHHQQQQQLPCGVGVDDVMRCDGAGIAQFLIDVTELGSPDQVDPVNKFHDVVCDLAYGCVVTSFPHVGHDDDVCTKSCCGADQLLLAPPTTTSGHASDDVTVDDSDSSTLLSTSRDGSDVTVTSSCASRAASVSGASDTGYMPSDDSATRDEREAKKLLLNHFDRTTSLDSSRSSSPARRSLVSSPLPSNSLEFDLDEVDATHRGCHRFVPRHPGELAIEISDPIYVEVEEDDLWCEGINLRTKQRGIFPTAYATDLSILDDVPRSRKFFLKFLGSIEVSYHRGNDVLCQAINKMVSSRRSAAQSCHPPPPLVCLEINEVGIKMSERTQNKKSILTDESSLAKKLARLLSKDREQPADIDHLFSLKNICFCGYHPKNDRYLGIITKHPIAMRFACHVFQSEKSTKTIAEVIGNSFQKFYQEYLAAVHPTEDFYLE